MRSRRTLRGKAREQGAIVLFLIVMIAIVSLTIHRFLPATTQSHHRNQERTVDELNALCFGLADYYFDKKAYPSSIADSNFGFKYFGLGINPSTAAYTGGTVQDQWYNKTNTTWTYRESSGTSPDYWKVWSVGPNFTNDSAAGDDIVRTQYAKVVATARTRRLLAMIRQACTYYTVTLSSGTWSGPTYRRGSGSSYTPASGATLGPEFDNDGWGNAFLIDTTNSAVYSKGPDEADGGRGGDDIQW